MRRTSRKHERGTALPEAGIVAPIFAMMFLMAGYLGKTYETKYQTLNQSRFDAFNASVTGCAGGTDSGAGDFNGVNGTHSGDGQSTAPTSAMSKSLLTANADSSASFSFWFDAGNIGTPQVKTIHSKSQVLCTERKHGLNVIDFVKDMFAKVPSK